MIRSSFEEGRAAGFLGLGRAANPYRKGMGGFIPYAIEEYASDWDSGYIAGTLLAKRTPGRLPQASGRLSIPARSSLWIQSC
jgi:hypothetical protein